MRLVSLAMVLSIPMLPWFAADSSATELDLDVVPTDAKWVAHVDVDALWPMTVVKNTWERIRKARPEAETQLRERLGLDITEDVYGVTMYGRSWTPEGTVILVHADIDEQVLYRAVKDAPNYQPARHAAHDMHTWKSQQGGTARTMAYTLFKPDLLVVGNSPEALRWALDVLDGREDSVVFDSPLAEKSLPGAVLEVRAEPSSSELPPGLQMWRETDWIRLTIGERKGRMFAKAEAEMVDAQAVGVAKSAIDGLWAMAALGSDADPLIMQSLDPLEVNIEDRRLTLDWSLPAEDVWKMLDEASLRARYPGQWNIR